MTYVFKRNRIELKIYNIFESKKEKEKVLIVLLFQKLFLAYKLLIGSVFLFYLY
jgi:hypothetical protein